ncbi:MAG: hypothetical protein RLO08_04525 [Parvibaculaceae bacterium]
MTSIPAERPTRRRYPLWLIIATAAASLATVAVPYLLFGLTEEGYKLAARYTVRVSFPLFLLTYMARPLAQLWRRDETRWLLRNRRYLGLSFALAHTVHLAALTAFFVFTPATPAMATVIGGGLGYALMFAMAATSNDASVRALGRNWNRLHTAGMHYLWFIFAFSYYGRLSGGRGEGAAGDLMEVGLAGFTLSMAALALRLAAAWHRRRKRAA